MDVLFYQGLIFTTLVLVRIISPRHLLAACIIWTVLTLVNLFWPPLIFLQLIVVWGTYNFIRPKDSLKANTGHAAGGINKDRFPGRGGATSADFRAAIERAKEIARSETETLTKSPPQKASVSQKYSDHTSDSTLVPKPKCSLRSTEIRAQVSQLGIPHLVHFTRCENLSSIFQYGLHSVASCRAKGIHAIRNDKIRLDGKLDGISLSMTFPNYRMFYKYRQMDVSTDWAVLILSSRILWEKECGFFKYNAADSRMRGPTGAQTMTAQALRDMYEGLDKPREHWLRPYDPSDPQAEVMVYEHIEPTFIETVAFETEDATDRWTNVLGGTDTICAGQGNGLFGSRAKVRGH